MEQRPFLMLGDDDCFTTVLIPLVDFLNINAIHILCIAGSLPLSVSREMKTGFKSIPRAILASLQTNPPKNGFFDVDEVAAEPLVAKPLRCCVLGASQMVFNEAALVPKDLVETKPANLLDSLPQSFLSANVKTLPGMLSKVNPDYLEAVFDAYRDLLAQSTKSEYYLDLFAIFLYLTSGLSEFIAFQANSKAFLSPVIFNPRYSIFGENPRQIELFRDLIFDITISKSQEVSLTVLIYLAERSPWLFVEQVLRFLNDVPRTEFAMFCSQRVLEALVVSAGKLQDLYIQQPTKECYIARLACFFVFLQIIRNPKTFPLAASLESFSAGVLHNVFEPKLSKFFFEELQQAFVASDFENSQLQFVPGFIEIMDFCTKTPNSSQLAELTIECVTGSISKKNPLISVFRPLLPCFLRYVVQDPKPKLSQQCFTFLSIAARYLPDFSLTSDVFQLFMAVIDKLNSQIEAPLFEFLGGGDKKPLSLIKEPVFLPLTLAAHRQSPRLVGCLETFSELCQKSRANCFAAHEGSLDFLLLEMVLHENHAFSFLGYQLEFSIGQSVAVPLVLKIVGHIMKVKTSALICERLIRFVIPGTSG
jgi:hypothetical protein